MGASSPSEYFFKLQVYHGREISRRITQDTLIMAGAEDHFVPLKHWWVCLDSNQEPDRSGALDSIGKFEQNQRFPIKIIHVCARLFMGFLPDNWWRSPTARAV